MMMCDQSSTPMRFMGSRPTSGTTGRASEKARSHTRRRYVSSPRFRVHACARVPWAMPATITRGPFRPEALSAGISFLVSARTERSADRQLVSGGHFHIAQAKVSQGKGEERDRSLFKLLEFRTNKASSHLGDHPIAAKREV